MANDLTTTATVSTVPVGTVIETYDTGSGHRQVVAIGTSGTKTFSDPAPTSSAGSIVAANANRKAVIIHNAGTVTCYLGNTSGVTTTNGLPLAPSATLSDDTSTDAWYAITASGTGDLRIVEVA